MTRRAANRLLSAGALLAPLAIVQAVRFLGGGLSPAPGAVIAPDLPALATPKPPSERQRRASEWLATYTPVLSGSPMDHADAVRPAQPVTEPTPDPEPTTPDPAASLVLTGLVGSGEGALASINHRVHRLGDEVSPGWRLVEIDSRRRVAVLEGPEGARIELQPPRGRR